MSKARVSFLGLIGTVGWVFLFNSIGVSKPKTICYSIQPNRYLNDHATDIAKIYDGFYFTIASWEDGARRVLGIDGKPPEEVNWMKLARKNLAALNKAGVTENFLTVYFGDSAEWPSAATLLSNEYTQKMAKYFAAIGRAARELKFRGVCIDIEYPYPRYALDHAIYTYDGYTVEDLLSAAKKQGRASMQAILDEFPEAVIITLPGGLRGKPIGATYQLGLLEAMAEREAPGGLHLGTEFTYCMHDPVTDLLTARAEDMFVPSLVDAKVQTYWRSHCTVAPGVWPLHMVETSGKDYPIRPWKEEVADLREQVSTLRLVSKRYIWSFTGMPVWYLHTLPLERKYGLAKQNLVRDDIDLRDWHRILMEEPQPSSEPIKRLIEKIHDYDRGVITTEELCDACGTPAHWWTLGMLGNPRSKPQFAAANAIFQPINSQVVHHGRDGAVRWFDWANLDPRGITECRYVFDNRRTDDASAQFVTFLHSDKPQQAFLNVGWDDGIVIRMNDKIVFDESDYPPRGHGWLFRDRYAFEKRVPITIEAGTTQLSVTSLNSHGNWMFSLRITDADGFPLQGLHLRTN